MLLRALALALGAGAKPGIDGALELLEGIHGQWAAQVRAARALSGRDALATELRQAIASPPKAAQLLALLYEEGDVQGALATLLEIAPLARHPAVSPTGAWVGLEAQNAHMHDAALAAALVELARAQRAASVLDLGCGRGEYVRAMQAAGIRAAGFDGNPETLALSEQRCFQADLARRLDAGGTFDLVLSLEVAEHLPPAHEAQFVDNLCRHVRRLAVVSWASGAGYGHFNVRDAAYVRRRLHGACGLVEHAEASAALRARGTFDWFRSDGLAVYLKT